jgi:hypothetical protein
MKTNNKTKLVVKSVRGGKIKSGVRAGGLGIFK